MLQVRRLNEADREAFLDAAITLWKVPTKEGRRRYGDQYTGMDRFVQVRPQGRSMLVAMCLSVWHY